VRAIVSGILILSIHNAGVGGSSPPVATKNLLKIKLLYKIIPAIFEDRNVFVRWATSGQPQRKKT